MVMFAHYGWCSRLTKTHTYLSAVRSNTATSTITTHSRTQRTSSPFTLLQLVRQTQWIKQKRRPPHSHWVSQSKWKTDGWCQITTLLSMHVFVCVCLGVKTTHSNRLKNAYIKYWNCLEIIGVCTPYTAICHEIGHYVPVSIVWITLKL